MSATPLAASGARRSSSGCAIQLVFRQSWDISAIRTIFLRFCLRLVFFFSQSFKLLHPPFFLFLFLRFVKTCFVTLPPVTPFFTAFFTRFFNIPNGQRIQESVFYQTFVTNVAIGCVSETSPIFQRHHNRLFFVKKLSLISTSSCRMSTKNFSTAFSPCKNLTLLFHRRISQLFMNTSIPHAMRSSLCSFCSPTLARARSLESL